MSSEADPPTRVLLVEDDPVSRLMTARLLRNAGYDVTAVADGLEALERQLLERFPILVTDWELPGIDGGTLCRRLRAANLDTYVYLVVLTSRTDRESVVAGLEAGADDYLAKPVHEAELRARLRTGCRIVALERSLRAANQRNEMLSRTDPLTGAYNRRHLDALLPQELSRVSRFGHDLAVIACDIDYFKRINDTHGHGVGDEVLKGFVERIEPQLRQHVDCLVRAGGEEFLIVLPETSLAGAAIVAEKLRHALAADPLTTAAGDIPVTASFGIAAVDAITAEGIDDAAAQLQQWADDGLYLAKQSGRNCVHASPAADDVAVRAPARAG